MHAITGSLVIAALLSIVGVLFTEPLGRFLGANDTFQKMVTGYLFWYSVFIIPSIFPMQMGMKGAAIATGVSQSVTMILMLCYFLRKKGKLKIQRFKPSSLLFLKIAIRGLPETVAQFAMPVTTLCMNYVLLKQIGDIGINAYSIINYVASFSAAVFFGSSEGLQPLFGGSLLMLFVGIHAQSSRTAS